MVKARLGVAALVLVMCSASPHGQDVVTAVDSIAAAQRQSRGLPGLSVAVSVGDTPLIAKGYGESDLEHHVPATADTIYKIGSITKPFTAALLLKLVSEGAVRLDDEIVARLPAFGLSFRGVTLRHLLTNTSGIVNYSELLGTRDRAVDLTSREVVQRFANTPLRFPPGTGWDYSNSNYFLLGLIIEQVTAVAYGEYAERTLRGVGIHDTVYCDSHRVIRGRARGYERGPEGMRNARHVVHYPDVELTVAVLTNIRQASDATAIATEIARVVMKQAAKAP